MEKLHGHKKANAQRQRAKLAPAETNKLMSSVCDSMIQVDSNASALLMQNLMNINNSINGSEIYIMNERNINAIYFKWLSSGLPALSEAEKESIEVFALSCPYINGSAVYKARSIYAQIQPLQDYNDLDICNAVGVYRNEGNGITSGLFDGENTFLNEMIKQSSFENNHSDTRNIADLNELRVYPNPASDAVTFDFSGECSSGYQIKIIDVLGRVIYSNKFSKNERKVKISMQQFLSGIYAYEYILDGIQKLNGKLVKD